MIKKTLTERLILLMKKHGVKCPKVAEITGYQAQTVRAWRCESSGRVIPKPVFDQLRAALDGRG